MKGEKDEKDEKSFFDILDFETDETDKDKKGNSNKKTKNMEKAKMTAIFAALIFLAVSVIALLTRSSTTSVALTTTTSPSFLTPIAPPSRINLLKIHSETFLTPELQGELSQLIGDAHQTGLLEAPEFNPNQPANSVAFFNNDNRCFFNSIIQAIYHDLTIRQVVARWSKKNVLALKLSNLFAYMDSVEPGTVINSQIDEFLPAKLANGRQQDAVEALDVLLDAMPDEDLQFLCPSQVKYIFESKPVQTSTKADEYMNTLHLSIHRPSSNLQIQDLIEDYFETESIEPEDYQKQEGMKSIEKKLLMSHHPKTLIITIKRFMVDGAHIRKFNEAVTATDSITLPNDVKYQLKSFVYHSGNGPKSGHYFAFVRNGQGFDCYDDRTIAKQATNVNSYRHKAYIYFYERIDNQ